MKVKGSGSFVIVKENWIRKNDSRRVHDSWTNKLLIFNSARDICMLMCRQKAKIRSKCMMKVGTPIRGCQE